jgi:clan AA aspartic protease
VISGSVTEWLEATITVTVSAPGSSGRSLVVVLDTGYDGALSLPEPLITELGLTWARRGSSELADGSVVPSDHIHAVVHWDGRPREVFVEMANNVPLLGTALLRGYELNAQMRPHGKLTLTRMPPKRRTRKRT